MIGIRIVWIAYQGSRGDGPDINWIISEGIEEVLILILGSISIVVRAKKIVPSVVRKQLTLTDTTASLVTLLKLGVLIFRIFSLLSLLLLPSPTLAARLLLRVP